MTLISDKFTDYEKGYIRGYNIKPCSWAQNPHARVLFNAEEKRADRIGNDYYRGWADGNYAAQHRRMPNFSYGLSRWKEDGTEVKPLNSPLTITMEVNDLVVNMQNRLNEMADQIMVNIQNPIAINVQPLPVGEPVEQLWIDDPLE